MFLYIWDVSSKENENWGAMGPGRTPVTPVNRPCAVWPSLQRGAPSLACCPAVADSAAQKAALVVPWGEEGKLLFSCERGFARFLISRELLTKPCSPKCPRANWMGFWNCSGLISGFSCHTLAPFPGITERSVTSLPLSSCLASTVSGRWTFFSQDSHGSLNCEQPLADHESSWAETVLLPDLPVSHVFFISDQHLHDPPVQLWEWPFGTVHFWEPGQVCAVLDQPSPADIASSPTCKKVLWNLPTGEKSLVAGEKAAFTTPSDFLRGVSYISSAAKLLI